MPTEPRMNSPTPRFTILVTIVEGRYFLRDPDCQLLVQCQFNDALFIENPETNSHSYPEVLSTDPVEQTPYPIWDTELAWDLDAEVLDILRVERASLKLNCYSINQTTREEESLGHIILDLSSAFDQGSDVERWASLTGSGSAGFRGLQPELKIAFTIDDGLSETAPTFDAILTSIDSTSGAEEVGLNKALKRSSKIPANVLHGLENDDDEDDEHFDDEDQDDGHVPVGDRSFYHSKDDHDTDVPEFEDEVPTDMEIPVDIGEARIPNEVKSKGYLQLGLGRDFFIFTITIQTTRNLEALVERYAASVSMDVEDIEQGLYLYYSFLGNNVATQPLSSAAEAGTAIEEIALRLKSSMESMYQHFQEDEQLVIHLCHESNLIGTATIPLAVILLHGTANLFHASPKFYPFQIQHGKGASKPLPSDVGFIQVAMHVTRDLNTLATPNTPAIRRSSQGTSSRRATRPAAIEVDMSRNPSSSTLSRSPRRHDYKFSIELLSFKAIARNLNNVSLRYNYRPFGPKSTQPPINASRMQSTMLPDASRTFQLCQTPQALRNQLKTPLAVEVWCQHPETRQNVLHASGQIHLIDIFDESVVPTSEGRAQRLHSSFVAVQDGGLAVGEVQFSCSLEDLGEYFDSQQSEILSTTPVHSMELHHQQLQQQQGRHLYQYHHSRGLSDELSTSGPEPQYGFHPRGNNVEVLSSEHDDERASQRLSSSFQLSHFAEGYSDHELMETSSQTPVGNRISQRPTSVRLSQVRHLSQAHQNSHPHHHHPYGKPSSPSGKTDPPMDYQMALKQQLAKQVELNRQVEMDLLRRSPISTLPHSIQQTIHSEEDRKGRTSKAHHHEVTDVDNDDETRDGGMQVDVSSDEMSAQQARQKMKDIKTLDYQVQKQLIALEFRERKLLRAEEALQRQKANFQKILDRHGYTQGAFMHPDQPFILQPSSSVGNGVSSSSGVGAGVVQSGPNTSGAQPIMASNPTPQDYFLLQDRFRGLQHQNQLLEAEFNHYRQKHPSNFNMASVQGLHQTIAELESTNSKLMNDVTFANNYKEHYKALWTHSLQEIASMRQDLQMGMEIKMMQQFNEVDQLKLMGMTRAEADHGQDRIILRGIKTELEMLQHQMQPLFPDDDMSWENRGQQEVPVRGSSRHHHHRRDDHDGDDDEETDEHSQYSQGGSSRPYPFQQNQKRHHSSQQQQQQHHQHGQKQMHYRGGQQYSNSGYEPFPSSISGNKNGASQASRFAQANTSLQEDEDEEHDDTLVDQTMMRSIGGAGPSQILGHSQQVQPQQQQKHSVQGGKLHDGSVMGSFQSTHGIIYS